jgi:putative ATPase
MTPLAEILRPRSLDEYIGQEHLIGPETMLRKTLNMGTIPSMILWGPPGVGKTTLANIISNQLNRPFFTLSAVNSGVKEVRNVIEKARYSGNTAILFIDEIHRFSKSQQDSLLGAVEKGIITLIGATTENPSFEVISPLLSRCQVYILKSLQSNELQTLLNKAIEYYKNEKNLKIIPRETEALIKISGGDARKLLNAVELIVKSSDNSKNKIVITNSTTQKIIQENLHVYDKQGEMHYDIISAFIKSLRGSDPNASLYWLARMVRAGEDPKFIARRMIILASEDIGNANPNALLLANACFDSVAKIGWPEARIILSQTAVYLACSPKSNSSYLAIDKALDIAEKYGDLPVPLHLRNAPTKLMKDIGYGAGYKYAHNFENNFTIQEYLPEDLSGTMIFSPGDNAREKEMKKTLNNIWKNKYNYD